MYTNNKCAVKIGKKPTHFFPWGYGVRQGYSLRPTLFNIYINKLTRALEQSAAPGLTLAESEVKCLLFADGLVLLSPTKQGLQQPLDLLHKFCQTWALSVNLRKTKRMVFQMSSCQDHKYKFHLDSVALEHTKKWCIPRSKHQCRRQHPQSCEWSETTQEGPSMQSKGT